MCWMKNKKLNTEGKRKAWASEDEETMQKGRLYSNKRKNVT